MEVVSGLGMGGAEKAFLNRLMHVPDAFKTIILNTRPELESWKSLPTFNEVKISRKKLSFAWKAKTFLKNAKPDLVILRTPIDLMIITFLKRISHQQFKVAFEAHSTRISSNKFLSTVLGVPLAWSIRRADLVIAVSKSVALGPQARSAKRTIISYLGATVDNRERSTKDVVFLFVGRFTKLKQPLLFLKAILRVKSDLELAHARVIFLGSGELEDKMASFIDSEKLSNIVSIVGYRSDLNSFYSDADYLVSTSKYEGLPISFFEAKLHGLKIITTPSSGDFDVLANEDILLPDFSEASIAGALLDAISQGSISRENRDEIRSQNSWMNTEYCSREYYKNLTNILFSED